MDDDNEEAPAAVREANARYYEAFEARDLDVMSDLWEHSDRVVCTHPGWSTLRGWSSVGSSFAALFGGPQQLQFVLTREHWAVEGDAAWVSVDENLLGDQGGSTVASLKVFVRTGQRWRMVGHHGSVVHVPVGRP